MISIREIENELAQKVTSNFHKKSFKICDDEDPRNFCILNQSVTKDHLERIQSMKIYEDDVWVITNPKCGTTLMQEMVWLIVNDFNFEKALQIDLDERMPFVEYEAISAGSPLECSTIQIAENLARPRIIKTHLPAFLLPKELFTVKPKIIYVARNPKDAAISWYHQHVHFHGWPNANLDFFVEAFVKDLMLYSSFNDHVLKFWEMRNESNLLFIHFEDMIKDLRSVIKEVGNFLEKSFSSENFEKLCEHVSFDKMRENTATNKAHMITTVINAQGRDDDWKFIRKGKIGSHKEELNEKQIKLLDEYVKNFEAKTDFRYKFK